MHCFLSLVSMMCLPCLHDGLSPLGINTRFFPSQLRPSVRGFFSRLARSRKINLTVPSGSASWPISAIHWHAYSIRDTLFSVLAAIRHSLSGSHLVAANIPSLCVLSLLPSMSLCMPVYVEREHYNYIMTSDTGLYIYYDIRHWTLRHKNQIQQRA